MKEDYNVSDPEEMTALKRAMERMHDALGVNYTSLGEVFETLEDMRIDFKPNNNTINLIRKFKSQKENLGKATNPVEFWVEQSMKMDNVVDAVRLYLEANHEQFPGCRILKNRILVLANKGAWA